MNEEFKLLVAKYLVYIFGIIMGLLIISISYDREIKTLLKKIKISFPKIEMSIEWREDEKNGYTS